MKLQNGPDPQAESEMSKLLYQMTFLYFETPSQIGYRTLKGSQSINDLSSFPDSSQASSGGVGGSGGVGSSGGTLPRPSRAEDEATAKPRDEASSGSANTSVEDSKAETGEAGGRSLRRACSLSDLNKPSVPRRILPAPPPNVSGKKGGGGGGPLMSSTPTRPASQSSEPERVARRERRKSIDERSDRGSDYGGRKGSAKSPGPGGVLSRLEQHERMLAERERERREHQRLVSLGRAPSRGELRPRSVTETESDRDLPSYMRSTSASSMKEKLTGGPVAGPGERSRRRSNTGHTQSQGDLRRITGDLQDTSSEEDASWTKHRATSSDRRHHGGDRPGPSRAKSER